MRVLDAYDSLTHEKPTPKDYHLTSATLRKIIAKKRLNKRQYKHLCECTWCRANVLLLTQDTQWQTPESDYRSLRHQICRARVCGALRVVRIVRNPDRNANSR